MPWQSKLSHILILLLLLAQSACIPLPSASDPRPPIMETEEEAIVEKDPAGKDETDAAAAGSSENSPESEAEVKSGDQPAGSVQKAERLLSRERISRPSIHSLRLHPTTQILDAPIIQLGTQDQLELLFDDLDAPVRPYRYRLLHCDRNWEASALEEFDYLDGINEVPIDNYAFSSATFQQYIHYRAIVPSKDLQITRSGNYALIGFDADYPDKVAFVKRFIVSEQAARLDAEVKRPNTAKYRETHQQIEVDLSGTSINASDPIKDVQLAIIQNGFFEEKPGLYSAQFVRNNQYDFSDPEQVFPAQKPWRVLNLRSLEILGEGVERINDENRQYIVDLLPDDIRSYKKFSAREDMDGNYFIASNDSDRDETESDYAEVRFHLPYPAPFSSGSIYIMGRHQSGLTQRHRMKYDINRSSYELSLFLKQGYYNYAYAYIDDETELIDYSAVEGNHFETQNEYWVITYLRDFSEQYDRVIATKKLRPVDY
jgi:hypothetical protein